MYVIITEPPLQSYSIAKILALLLFVISTKTYEKYHFQQQASHFLYQYLEFYSIFMLLCLLAFLYSPACHVVTGNISCIRDKGVRSPFSLKEKIEKVPRDIRGEKSSKDMVSSRNLVSTIGALASPKMGDGTRFPEGQAFPAG